MTIVYTTETMKESGRPLAQTYRGSGRLTGYTAPEPVYMNTGEVAPDWVYVGDMTLTEFDNAFEEEEREHLEMWR